MILLILVYVRVFQVLTHPASGVKPLYEMCLDYISQSNTEQPENKDIVTDILSRWLINVIKGN